MVFVPRTDWVDEPSHATPILAEDLLRIEAGVAEGMVTASETVQGNVQLATDAVMTTGTSLSRVPSVKKVVDYVAAALASLPSTGAATEAAAGIVELASTAEMTTGTDTSRVPSVVKVAAYVAAAISALQTTVNASIASLSAATTAALSGKADKSGSWNQFSDVADTAYTEGDSPIFTSGALTPIDFSQNFAGLDGALRLDPGNFPQFYVPTVIIPEGDVPPGTFPAYGLVGKLPAAASLIPTILAVGSVRAANNVVLTLPEALAIGDYVGFSLAWENSTPFDHISGAFGGAGAGTGTFDFATYSVPNATAGTVNGFVKITGVAAAGSTITFTARDATNAAITRPHLIGSIYRLPNLVSTLPRDQQAVNGGSSSSTLTAIGATVGTTTSQPSEVAIGSAVNSAGTAPNTRDISGTNGWNTLVDHLSDNGSSGRRLYVGYKVLTAAGLPSLTTTVALSGTATQTGAWAAEIVTYKGL